jgi:hypothetical protein
MQHSTISASNVITPLENKPILSNNLTEVDDLTAKIPQPRRKIPFWSENPNIIFNSKYIMEFFPTENMSYEQKLNSVTRTVIILTMIGFGFTHNLRTIIIGIITAGAIFSLFYYHKKEINNINDKKKSQQIKENFEGKSDIVSDLFNLNNMEIPENIFEPPSTSNPFGNVLVTDYDYNPDKKPAPPSFNTTVNQSILDKAKQFVSDANPDHPDIADKLFKDMGSQLGFEQSLRPFSSNPSTTIPNDQEAFAEFCYGGMTSCKEGNTFACARNLSRHTN